MERNYRIRIPEMISKNDHNKVDLFDEGEVVTASELQCPRDGYRWILDDNGNNCEIPKTWLENISSGPVSAEKLFYNLLDGVGKGGWDDSDVFRAIKKTEENYRKRIQPVIDFVIILSATTSPKKWVVDEARRLLDELDNV